MHQFTLYSILQCLYTIFINSMSLNENVELISGAANTSGPSSAIWLPCRPSDGTRTIVAFIIHNLIAIADVDLLDKSDMKIVCTLKGHTKLVNAITHIDVPGVGTEIYSCGEDGTVRVWRRRTQDAVSVWTAVCVLPNERKGILGLQVSGNIYAITVPLPYHYHTNIIPLSYHCHTTPY